MVGYYFGRKANTWLAKALTFLFSSSLALVAGSIIAFVLFVTDQSTDYVLTFLTRGVWAAAVGSIAGMVYGQRHRPDSSRSEKITDPLDNVDESVWEQASKELNSDSRNEGLWAKAFAISEGDENRAKAKYIELRVVSLAEETEDLVIRPISAGQKSGLDTGIERGLSTKYLLLTLSAGVLSAIAMIALIS